MSESFFFDVFLCHSAKDQPVAREIAARLREDGLRVWYDEWVLKPDDNLPSKIEEGLEHCRVLVLCMSANAFGSDWAQLEGYTVRFRDPFNKERRFIPLRLDDAPIKGSLEQFLYLNWRPPDLEQAYAKLRDACRAAAKPSPTQAVTARNQAREKVIQLNRDSSKYSTILDCAFSSDGKRALTGGDDQTVRLWDMETGSYARILQGHSATVYRTLLSADGRLGLSGSFDGTLRYWDVEGGRCLGVIAGNNEALGVAWAVEQRLAFVGYFDRSVRLWHVDTGQCLRECKGHGGLVRSTALSIDGTRALSGADDKTVRLWNVENGRSLQLFEGHTDSVSTTTFRADGRRVLSGSFDNTLRLWDSLTGRCLRVLEGHTSAVSCVAWNANDRLALSGSLDRTVQLWDVESGRCLHVLTGHTEAVVTVSWCPDGRHAFSADARGGIRLWDLSELVDGTLAPDVSVPVRSLAPDQVQYTNAKVLLVGDTGVGKSALAERLIGKEFVPTKPSHARKAYVLESETSPSSDGIAVHHETLLWDLGGQPARLVYQLSMEEAALACVLIDNRSVTDPFESAAYWSQVLDQVHTGTKLRKFLVASRTDVGALPATRERIEAFADEHGFSRFISTSAFTGEGCDTLLEAIRAGIAWGELPTVTTEGPLAPLRAYVVGLKGEQDGRSPLATKLFTVAQLHEGFVADYGRKIPLDEFIALLERLEAADAVDLLLFHSTGAKPQPETRVLLDPTRVDAYASALLVAAKDAVDGPGHLLESRVREGSFKLDAEERLADPECEKYVLWFVMESLLVRDLALRERIKGADYFVFPSQCAAELRSPGAAPFGVAFSFKGAVRSVYASLIAQLAHFERFRKCEFFQDAAAYRPEAGGRCIVRLRDLGSGQGELELSFESETPGPVRQGFIEFVGKHLESKSTPASITRRHAHRCANGACGEPFPDALVRARLAARKRRLLCPYCEKKTPLLNLLASPSTAADSVTTEIASDANAGRQRMTAALVISAKKAQGKFDIFLSHNSKDKPAVEKIANRLLAVGIRPWLDEWELSPGDTLSDALEHAIETIPCAALCFGPADVGRWHIMEIRAYVERWATGSARMIPTVLPGVREAPELPVFVRQTVWVDMREWEKKGSDGFYRFVCGILRRPPGDSPSRRFGVRDVAEWQGRMESLRSSQAGRRGSG